MKVKRGDRVEFTTKDGEVVRGKVVYIGRDEPRVVAVQPDGTLDERGAYESQLRPLLPDTAPRSYVEVRALLDASLASIPPYDTPARRTGTPTGVPELPAGALPVDGPVNARCACCGIEHAEQFRMPYVEHAADCPALHPATEEGATS